MSGSGRANALLALAATLLAVLVVEATLRAVGFDFAAYHKAPFDAYPIFYRQPLEPLGEVYFRREGPAAWTGRVLGEGMRADGALDGGYPDEPLVTIRYDRLGFRNPEGLADWGIAVVGDSFVELGHLPDEALFTTELGRRLGTPVANFGASYSGPFTYVAYLEHFAKAPSTRDAVLVFFEGNDLADAEREAGWLRRFAETGVRSYRRFERQPSFVRALFDLVRAPPASQARAPRLSRNALFAAAGGERPVTLHYTPPRAGEVGEGMHSALDAAFARWAEASRRLGLRPWVVYMPCKRRVLHERLRFLPETPPHIAAWTPTDLPELVRQLAERHGLAFIDPTPALLRETRAGRLTYNHVWDTHLDRHGSAIVAGVLAEALGAAGS